MAGYQATELGSLPADWATARLDELFNIQQGKALGPKSRTGISPRPFLRTANVLWGRLQLSVLDQMDFSADEVARLALKKDDLLVCEGGDIGRTAIWRNEVAECCYQNHIHRLRRKRSDVEPEFFMYWMQAAIRLLGLYTGQANKTTIPNLSKARLSTFVVPVPPLTEQRAIARVLRTVQRAREQTEAVIAATRQLKASLMRHLFTYGPVPVDQAERVPLKETEIGPVPEHWRLSKIGEVAVISSGGTPERATPTYWGGGIPWVKTAEVNYRVIKRTEETITQRGLRESSARIIPVGTLLMAMYGQGVTRGRVAILGIDAAINQACAAIYLPRDVSTWFAYHYLVQNYKRIRELGHGAHQKNLSAALIKTFPIPIPSVAEQNEIARTLRAVDRKLEAEHSRKGALDTLFATLLHDLMKARVRVKSLVLYQPAGIRQHA